jgi:hypothetical protein
MRKATAGLVVGIVLAYMPATAAAAPTIEISNVAFITEMWNGLSTTPRPGADCVELRRNVFQPRALLAL